MELKFEILGEPKGKGRPRFSTKTGRAITPTATVNYETLVHMEYIAQCGGKKFDNDDMIYMEILAYYEIPKSKSKKVKAQMEQNIIRPTKKPDIDNVVKIVADSLNKVAYRDDTQIVDCVCRKFYSYNPRVVVIMKKIT